MKNKIIRIIVLIMVVGGLAGGLYYHYFLIEKTPKNLIEIYGNVDIRQVQLAFYATGRVQDLFAREGDHVKAGQMLARLDKTRYKAALAKAEADLESRQAMLTQLETGSRPETIDEAKAGVAAAEARLKDAERLFERTKALRATNVVSRQQLDDQESAHGIAQADLEQARQTLILAQKGPRKEEVDRARAEVKAADASLMLAQKELDDTEVFSPGDGVIQNRILEVGDMAFPQAPVYTLALTNPVWVRAYLPEPDLGRVAPGMKASVKTDSFPGKSYAGWIGYISPTAEFTPKPVETEDLRSKLVYQVRVYVCNPDQELRLGMPVTVDIPLNQETPGPEAVDQAPCRGK